jgi:long-chain acyl-CoA synthetase
MTETAAAISLSEVDDPTMGHCGPPIASAEVRLREVPEMGYSPAHNPPTGELMIRGPSVFQGYYKNKESTDETIVNGWIATGDIGRFNPTGTLSIIDRKKNIFKIQHGEYVAAEALETHFMKDKLVTQCFIYGNSYKTSIIAVIVPQAINMCEIAVAKRWWPNTNPVNYSSPEFRADFKKMCDTHEAEVKDLLMNAMKSIAVTAKLKAYEIPVDVIVESDIDEEFLGFNQKNECLTPTSKLRRPFLLQRYKEKFMSIYTKKGEPPKEGEKW